MGAVRVRLPFGEAFASKAYTGTKALFLKFLSQSSFGQPSSDDVWELHIRAVNDLCWFRQLGQQCLNRPPVTGHHD